MDERFVEQAEALAEKLNEEGRKACSKEALPDEDLTPDQYKTTECDECEDPLPPFRMQKGLTLCVPCQERLERARKR